MGLDFINKLRPVSYQWNSGADTAFHYGLIAQETEKAVQSSRSQLSIPTPIVDHDSKSDRYGLRYTELISPIIKATQELYGMLKGAVNRMSILEAHDATQDRLIATLDLTTKELSEKVKEIEALKARMNELEKGRAHLLVARPH